MRDGKSYCSIYSREMKKKGLVIFKIDYRSEGKWNNAKECLEDQSAGLVITIGWLAYVRKDGEMLIMKISLEAWISEGHDCCSGRSIRRMGTEWQCLLSFWFKQDKDEKKMKLRNHWRFRSVLSMWFLFT